MRALCFVSFSPRVDDGFTMSMNFTMSTSTHYKLTIMSFKRRLIKIIQSGELKLLHTGRSMNNVDDRYLSSMSCVIRRIESEIE